MDEMLKLVHSEPRSICLCSFRIDPLKLRRVGRPWAQALGPGVTDKMLLVICEYACNVYALLRPSIEVVFSLGYDFTNVQFIVGNTQIFRDPMDARQMAVGI